MNTICETKKELIDDLKKDIGKENVYYVYRLIDPANNLPFYIGMINEKSVLHSKFPNGNKLLYFKIKKWV